MPYIILNYQRWVSLASLTDFFIFSFEFLELICVFGLGMVVYQKYEVPSYASSLQRTRHGIRSDLAHMGLRLRYRFQTYCEDFGTLEELFLSSFLSLFSSFNVVWKVKSAGSLFRLLLTDICTLFRLLITRSFVIVVIICIPSQSNQSSSLRIQFTFNPLFLLILRSPFLVLSLILSFDSSFEHSTLLFLFERKRWLTTCA